MRTESTPRVDLIVDCRNTLAESPVWDDRCGTLYWVDVTPPACLYCWRFGASVPESWQVGGLATGVELTDRSTVLLRRTRDIVELDLATGSSMPIFELPHTEAGMRFNDGHCDSAGRLWIGTMQNNFGADGSPVEIVENTGCIYVISTTLTHRIEARLGCPNALCWSRDGRTLYVADSCDGSLYAYTCAPDRLTLTERRRLFHRDGFGIPDGAAVDKEGFIWNARWGAGAVARISPDGQLDRIVEIPVRLATSCCFGGSDWQTLFVTSARYGLSEEALHDQPHAGGIFSFRVDVPGLKLTPFRHAARNEAETST